MSHLELTIIVTSVYFPPTGALEKSLADLQETLRLIMDSHQCDVHIVAGDFNSRLGPSSHLDPNIVKSSTLLETRTVYDTHTNQRGKLLLEAMEANGFVLLNGRTRSDTPGHFTFCNLNGQSTIDLIWVNILGICYIKNMWVDDIWSTSDHFPVTVEIYNPATTALPQSTSEGTTDEFLSLRWNSANKEQFLSELLDIVTPINYEALHTDQLNDLLLDSITSAARNCDMLAPSRSRKNPQVKPWFDSDCRALKAIVNSSYRRCKIFPSSPQSWEIFQTNKSAYQDLLKSKKSNYIKDLQEKFANVRNSAQFWNVIRSVKKHHSCSPQVSLESWNLFYNSIYTPKPHLFISFAINYDPDQDSAITMHELLKSISKVKLKKAAGSDGIANEFIKELPHSWLHVILVLFNKILDSGVTPIKWSEIIMCMLHKKGDPEDPNNYRGIALVNCITKVFTEIIHERIKKWAESKGLIPEEQAGFRSGRGCEDNIFVLQAILHLQARFKGSNTYTLFIDFKRAFDSVQHDNLWSKLTCLGLSSKIIRLLANLYKNISMRVRCSGKLSTPIQVTEGVLQGEILSPLLFSLYISDFVSYLKSKGAEGLFIDRQEILALMYADDIALLASTEIKLRKSLRLLDEFCQANYLTVNTQKTFILITRSSGRLPKKPCNFSYKGDSIKVVSSFEYLGVTFSSSLNGNLATTEAVKRCRLATGAVLGIINNLNSSAWAGVSKLHSSMVRSTLAYMAHIWGLNPGNLEKLESANLLLFKRLLNLPMCTPGYALRLELDLDHFSLSALKAAVNWVIKILEMPNDRLPKVCLSKLIAIKDTPLSSARLNWIQQLSDMLVHIGEESLILNSSADFWKYKKEEILAKYKLYSRSLDIERYRTSSACHFIFDECSLSHYSSKHILCQLPCHLAKLLCQLRLASNYACHISIGKLSMSLHPTKTCPSCFLGEPDTISHFLQYCPAFNEPRKKYLAEWISQDIHRDEVLSFPDTWDSYSANKLFAFCKQCHKIRAGIS